ncbi:MAG TPA: 50S ribosomal protein L29 [Thermodesulfobacteriota bacterium]|nr:50S ribosomal protein L29 [Thermodesulfobacteriota bacterium]
MKPSELRAMGIEELKNKEGELRKEFSNLSIQHSLGSLENPIKLRFMRKDIARVKTIILEMERKIR